MIRKMGGTYSVVSVGNAYTTLLVLISPLNVNGFPHRDERRTVTSDSLSLSTKAHCILLTGQIMPCFGHERAEKSDAILQFSSAD